MKDFGADDYVVTSMIGLQLLTAFILLCTGMRAIHQKRNKKVADLLILHLLCTEFVAVIWSIIHCFSFLLSSTSVYFTIDVIVITTIINATIHQIICLTLDRVLIVAFTLKYGILVSKSHLIPVFVLTWFVALLHGLGCGLVMKEHHCNALWLIWDIVVTIVIIVSYMYIMISVYKQRSHTSVSNTNASYRCVKYRVPLLVSFSLILFKVIPDLLVFSHAIGVTNKWMTVLYIMGAISDPLVYVLQSKKGCCKRENRRNKVVPQKICLQDKT